MAMASNLIAMASNLVAMASNLAGAYNLIDSIGMASNLIAMASNLIAMAPSLWDLTALPGRYTSFVYHLVAIETAE